MGLTELLRGVDVSRKQHRTERASSEERLESEGSAIHVNSGVHEAFARRRCHEEKRKKR